MSTVKEATGLLAQIQAGVMPWGTVYAVMAAVLTSALIIAAVGFGPEALHNAAHDIRHGLAFPCH